MDFIILKDYFLNLLGERRERVCVYELCTRIRKQVNKRAKNIFKFFIQFVIAFISSLCHGQQQQHYKPEGNVFGVRLPTLSLHSTGWMILSAKDIKNGSSAQHNTLNHNFNELAY